MSNIKDRLLLIITALIGSALSVVFFRITKEYGLLILTTITNLCALAEIHRLQTKVKRLEQQLDAEGTP